MPSGFAAGVLARADGKGRAFGYFFGPRVQRSATLDTAMLSPPGAVLVCKFGDYGLRTRRWPVVNRIASFSRTVWALPRFQRDHDSKEYVYVTEYNDSFYPQTEMMLRRHEVDLSAMPEDIQFGSDIVESKLSKLIGKNELSGGS
jgi:hypothetical protein